MAKQQRKTYSGEKNDKARTMGKLVVAVGVVLREKGYTGLTIANISRAAGVDRKLVTLYFGSVENLVEIYIKDKDYWVGSTLGAVEYFGKAPKEGSRGFLESLLMNQMEEFSKNIEMQRVVAWQISEKSEIMSKVNQEREKMSALFFAFSDKEQREKDVDLRAISALLVSSVYYLTLHAKNTDSPFCEINLDTPEGMERIRKAVKQVLGWAYGDR